MPFGIGGNKWLVLAIDRIHAVVPAREGRLDIANLALRIGDDVSTLKDWPQTGHQKLSEPCPYTPLHGNVDCRHGDNRYNSLRSRTSKLTPQIALEIGM